MLISSLSRNLISHGLNKPSSPDDNQNANNNSDNSSFISSKSKQTTTAKNDNVSKNSKSILSSKLFKIPFQASTDSVYKYFRSEFTGDDKSQKLKAKVQQDLQQQHPQQAKDPLFLSADTEDGSQRQILKEHISYSNTNIRLLSIGELVLENQHSLKNEKLQNILHKSSCDAMTIASNRNAGLSSELLEATRNVDKNCCLTNQISNLDSNSTAGTANGLSVHISNQNTVSTTPGTSTDNFSKGSINNNCETPRIAELSNECKAINDTLSDISSETNENFFDSVAYTKEVFDSPKVLAENDSFDFTGENSRKFTESTASSTTKENNLVVPNNLSKSANNISPKSSQSKGFLSSHPIPTYEEMMESLENENSLPTYQTLSEQRHIDPFQHSLFFKKPEEVEYYFDSNLNKQSHLPSYAPTKYKLAVALIKFEKNQLIDIINDSSLFNEVMDNNKWKLVVIELNSTQFNLYRIDLSHFHNHEISFLNERVLVKEINEDKEKYYNDPKFKEAFYDSTHKNFEGVDMFDAINFNNGVLPLGSGAQFCAHYNKYHGNQEKLKLKSKLEKGAKKSGLFKNINLSSVSDLNQQSRKKSNPPSPILNLNSYAILKKVIKNPRYFLSESQLIRTFSLQYGKIGLANDFYVSKKEQLLISSIFGVQHCPDTDVNTNNILRLRLEVYQLLINFKYLNELINWYNAIVNGIDVSLDLQVREMPKFNNVPSRRRRRRRRHAKKKNKRKRLRSRALSSANEFLNRSRRNTATSSVSQGHQSDTGSRDHRRQSSIFSNSDGGSFVYDGTPSNSGIDERQQQIGRLRAKNSAIVNYFLSEFDPPTTQKPSYPKQQSSIGSFVRKRSNSNSAPKLFRSFTSNNSFTKDNGKSKLSAESQVDEVSPLTNIGNTVEILTQKPINKGISISSPQIPTKVVKTNKYASEESGSKPPKLQCENSLPIHIPQTRTSEPVSPPVSPTRSPSSPLLKTAAFGNSRERSNSLNKLHLARSNHYLTPTPQIFPHPPLVPQMSPRMSIKSRERSNSASSKFTIDSNANNNKYIGNSVHNHMNHNNGAGLFDGNLAQILGDFKYRANSAASMTSGTNSGIHNVSPTRSEVSFEKVFGLIDKKSIGELEIFEKDNNIFPNLTVVLDQSFNLTLADSEVTEEGKELRKELERDSFEEEHAEGEGRDLDAEDVEDVEDEDVEDVEDEDEEDEDEDEEEDYDATHIGEDENSEDREDDEEDVAFEFGFDLTLTNFNNEAIIRSENTEYKWYPLDKNPTTRRIVKDSLKSMTVLRATDSWINSRVVREAVVPNLHFFKNKLLVTRKSKNSRTGEVKVKEEPDRKQNLAKTVKYYKYYVVGIRELIQLRNDRIFN